MARISRTSYTAQYETAQQSARSLGETNDCGVKAVMMVTGVTYEEAHEALRKAGRKNRQGTYNWHLTSALRELGFATRRWSTKDRIDMIHSYPGNHKALGSITTHHPRRFPKAWAPMADKNLLMFTRGHVAAFSQGQVHDWTINRACRVNDIWEVYRP